MKEFKHELKQFSAGAIIFYDSKNQEREYLLLKHNPRYWGFPKGHIEKGESYEKTIRREVEEETNIKRIKIIKGFKKSIRYFLRGYDKESFKNRIKNDFGNNRENIPKTDKKRFVNKNIPADKNLSYTIKDTPWVFKLVTFYLAQSLTKNVKISFEHRGFKWLPYEKALKLIKYKNFKELLKQADEYLKKNYDNLK